MAGEADFHALAYRHGQVYGYRRRRWCPLADHRGRTVFGKVEAGAGHDTETVKPSSPSNCRRAPLKRETTSSRSRATAHSPQSGQRGSGVDGEMTQTFQSGESGDSAVTLQEGSYTLWYAMGNHRAQGDGDDGQDHRMTAAATRARDGASSHEPGSPVH